MKLRELLFEEVFYEGPIRPRWGDPVDIMILKNPSRHEFFRLMAASTYKRLRGLLDNDLYVWDADLADHSTIANHFPNTDGSDLEMDRELVVNNSVDPDLIEETREWIRTNRRLISLYGKNFRFTLRDDDGNTFES